MGFNKNFKTELSYSGMTVKELSALTGINQNTLNNYLSKRGQIPSVETGAKIARSLGVSTESLVFGEEASQNEELSAVIRLFKMMPEKKRKFLFNFIKLLSRNDL